MATVESEASSSAPAAEQQWQQRAAQAAAAQQQNGAEAGFVSKRSVRLQRSFPLTAVVGMDVIKQALLLGACDTGRWHVSLCFLCMHDLSSSAACMTPALQLRAQPSAHACRSGRHLHSWEARHMQGVWRVPQVIYYEDALMHELLSTHAATLVI